MTDPPHIVVLDHDAHGIPAIEYANILQNRLPEHTISHAATPTERKRLLDEARVVAGSDLSKSEVDAAENIQLFACNTAGVEHLPLETLAEQNVAVTNASGVHGPNVAEHVLGWVLMFARRLDEGQRRQARREWRRFKSFTELAGSTVTIVGLGSIGEAVVQRFEGFDVTTLGVRHSPSKGGLTEEVFGYDDLSETLTRTDVLVLCCPLTELTENLISTTEFNLLPTDAIVVNVARGGIIDTPALVDALRWNNIHGAALDVTDPEPLPSEHDLWTFENVLLTPHVSGHTPNYWERRADILVENIEYVAANGAYKDLRNQIG
jgi:phosphoglycerate dehydrogenase-like enzyme